LHKINSKLRSLLSKLHSDRKTGDPCNRRYLLCARNGWESAWTFRGVKLLSNFHIWHMQLYFQGYITKLHQPLTPSNKEKLCENSKNRASGERCNLQSCSTAPKPTTPQVQSVGASSHYMVQNSSLSECQNLLLYRNCHPYYPYSYSIVD